MASPSSRSTARTGPSAADAASPTGGCGERRPRGAGRRCHRHAETRTGPARQLRALLVARRSTVRSRTRAELQLRSLILELNDETRACIDRKRIVDLTTACAALTGADGTSLALAALARRWQHLHAEVRDNDTHVEKLVRQTAPGLVS